MSKTIDKSLTKKLMVQSLTSAKSKFLSLIGSASATRYIAYQSKRV
jgi:hypothetical protein